MSIKKSIKNKNIKEEVLDKREFITIEGARVNNLKNISVKIPRNKLVVVSGLSGSGKSSLAFETLFAEGQRRFAESLSSFARQFLGRMSKPAVDKIEGIPPAIAIEQKVNTRNPRSTVGTTTEIYDYLRLLFAKIGKTYSPISGCEVKCESVQDVVNYVESQRDVALYILAPFGWENKEERVEKLLMLKEQGYNRLFSNGETIRVDKVLQNLESYSNSKLSVLVDRFKIGNSFSEDETTRMRDSIGSAFEVGGERVVIAIQGGNIQTNSSIQNGSSSENNSDSSTKNRKEKEFTYKNFSTLFEADGIIFEEPNELMFSYNNPLGACPVCGGYGSMVGIDESLVVPNPSMSLYEGAVACWRGESMGNFLKEFIFYAADNGFPIHKPYAELTKEQKKLLWKGNSFVTGIYGFFDMVESKKYKIQYKYMLARYSGKSTCKECDGSRLRRETTYVKIGGKTITELMDMSVTNLNAFFKSVNLDKYESGVADRAIKEVKSRLNYIEEVGLGYLTLNRAANTLSGGESQRLNLVSSLGSSLVGSLYILDEPSIGLHPKDTAKLITVIKRLQALGNTVLIVEHDREIILASNELIDIGPHAGINGGEVVFQGAVQDGINDYLLPDKSCVKPGNNADASSQPKGGKSLTIEYLSGIKKLEVPKFKREWSKYIEVAGAIEHNLKGVDVKFPLGVITAVTGVSGSGKSSLVGDILHPALAKHFQQFGIKPGAFKELRGDLDKITSVEFVDQHPIGKSSRSNPVTYLKIYDDIRKLFSEQQFAKMNGFGNSHFSFNMDGGRCPVCLGDGFITIPMQFMADVRMVCEECGGKRFKPIILEVKYKGKDISQILEMSVVEAIAFFEAQPESGAKKTAKKLRILDDVGLGYVKLGQSSSSLSGGESQRIKLAQFLSKEYSGKSAKAREYIFFIFDEPTTGLHFHDIRKLLKAFQALVDKGHTIVVVEHNTDVIKAADWVIDMGPEGGDAGGTVCFTGTPEELAKSTTNATGMALAE